MLNRKLVLISNTIGELLVKQLAHELKNYTLYTTYANYFSIKGISDLDYYYRKRAEEEKNHHQWIADYLADADYSYMHPEVEINTEVIEEIIDPFNQTIIREVLTTQLLYNIYEKAISEKDYMTASWLYDKLIKEQIEEENTSRMATSIMELDSDILLKAKQVLKLLK
jgi:ferritin